MKTKYISNAFLMLAMIGIMTSCISVPKMGNKTIEVPLVVSNQSVPTTYRNLEKTVRLNVTSSVTGDAIYDDSNLPKSTRLFLPQYVFIPSVRDFVIDATTSYMQRMRFDITPTGDFRFDVDIKTFKMEWIDKQSVECKVVINYKLLDGTGQTIVPSSTASSLIRLASTEQFGNGLGRAYAEALNKVNWDRIAKCLMIAKSPTQEGNAQVTGAGDTAPQHTVIRW